MPPKLLAPQMFLICYSWMPQEIFGGLPNFLNSHNIVKLLRVFLILTVTLHLVIENLKNPSSHVENRTVPLNYKAHRVRKAYLVCI